MYHYSKKRRAKKIWGIALMAPLVLLVIAGFFGSIYAAYEGIENISWATSVIFAIIIAMYFAGVILHKKE